MTNSTSLPSQAAVVNWACLVAHLQRQIRFFGVTPSSHKKVVKRWHTLFLVIHQQLFLQLKLAVNKYLANKGLPQLAG